MENGATGRPSVVCGALSVACALFFTGVVTAEEHTYPPVLPDGRTLVTDASHEMLRAPAGFREDVQVAQTPPRVDFLFYPHQDYKGKPWSNWGHGCVKRNTYYSAIGDHLSPRGTAMVYAYDAQTQAIRRLVSVKPFLESTGTLPADMDYTPGKIHSRLQPGRDGWLYFSTHRGSTRTTDDAHGYAGDWILRTQLESGKTEIVAAHPVSKHALPASVLDPERLLFYAGTAPGKDAAKQSVQLLVYDLANRKVKLLADDGFKRCAIFSRSTGCLYWNGRKYDPDSNRILTCEAVPSVRSATTETNDGVVYGTTDRSADIWAFDVKKETCSVLGSGAVGQQTYITSMEVDPTGRYLYYVPGAHGKGAADGTPVVQFDVRKRTPKVLAFLVPFYPEKYGYTPDGTFSVALDAKGERLFITWNGMRKGSQYTGAKGWECCALTVIHIPESERGP